MGAIQPQYTFLFSTNFYATSEGLNTQFYKNTNAGISRTNTIVQTSRLKVFPKDMSSGTIEEFNKNAKD
jgi:hypothetical protein